MYYSYDDLYISDLVSLVFISYLTLTQYNLKYMSLQGLANICVHNDCNNKNTVSSTHTRLVVVPLHDI